MPSVKDRISDAIQNGEVLRIVYLGGSQPGTAREIGPITVTNEEVLAEELATGRVKAFKLAKVEVLDEQEQVPSYDSTLPAPLEDSRSIGETLKDVRQELEQLGWYVQLDRDSIGLHRYFKNGKPKKGSDVGLSYEEWAMDLVDDFDGRGLKELRRPSQRPYRVHSRNFECDLTPNGADAPVLLCHHVAAARGSFDTLGL
jgi:hypothetical protein